MWLSTSSHKNQLATKTTTTSPSVVENCGSLVNGTCECAWVKVTRSQMKTVMADEWPNRVLAREKITALYMKNELISQCESNCRIILFIGVSLSIYLPGLPTNAGCDTMSSFTWEPIHIRMHMEQGQKSPNPSKQCHTGVDSTPSRPLLVQWRCWSRFGTLGNGRFLPSKMRTVYSTSGQNGTPTRDKYL